MAPPVTPSPHRFLIGQPGPPSSTKDSRKGPALYVQPKSSAERCANPNQPPSSQFAPTPRFGKIRSESHRPPSPPKAIIAQALRASIRTAEAVEDAAEHNEDDEMLDSEQAHAVTTTADDASTTLWTNDLTLSPKRRRLDADEYLFQPEVPTSRHPQTPSLHAAKTMTRALPPQTQDTVSTRPPTTAVQRPAFLRPSVAMHDLSEPLPDAFSPQKRGQKFVPGGMAAMMQQWVLEAGQAAIESRKGQSYLRGEDYVMRVKVDSLRGGGPVVVGARAGEGEPSNLILAGTGQADAARALQVSRGSCIGIRAPAWRVELQGKAYEVAVDWRVLS